MIFHKHPEMDGSHSFLSPSQSSRFNYDEEKLIKTYSNIQKVERGTDLHALAESIIRFNLEHKLDIPITLAHKGTAFDMYVNDAIRFKMTPEVHLYFSYYCNGTADAIKFENNFLRIHDLKTGDKPVTSFGQLERYAALFLLEYGTELNITPFDISYEFRIYQDNERKVSKPEPNVIAETMNYIMWASMVLEDKFGKKGELQWIEN